MWGGGSHSDPARPQHQRGAVMWPALGYDTPRSPRPAAHNSPLPTEPGKTPQAPSSHFPQLSCCARPPPPRATESFPQADGPTSQGIPPRGA